DAQDDNPYAEPAAPPAARPVTPKPPAAHTPVAPKAPKLQPKLEPAAPADKSASDVVAPAAKMAKPDRRGDEPAAPAADPHAAPAADPHAAPAADPHAAPAADPPAALETDPHAALETDPHAALETDPHAALEADPHGGKKGLSHATGEGEHGGAHGGHDPHGAPGHMNWFYGFLGTDAELEPSLLWRKPDMPPPFLANLINFAVFAYIIVRFGKKPLQEALTSRKQAITKDIDAAQKMKADAEKRLSSYEDKLRHIDDEMDRIRKDFREQGERDKKRILDEAREKRERMLKDAQFLIEQEAKKMRTALMNETVEAAMRAAEKMLRERVTAADQDRVAEDFLKELASFRGGLGVTKGGCA
ncbi:MAG: ATP synthase F0 subunit B, partial [Polyangiaceae bacterium]|nr:ATP synthase F0 subunit B [Polyangiaceae bacterium]